MLPEQQAALSQLRRIAAEAFKREQAARLDGTTKMREIWRLEAEHRNACRMVYAYENLVGYRQPSGFADNADIGD